VAVLVVGGGVCGVLAGQRCAAKGMSFRLVDAGEDFGGVWRTLANTHSQLQVGAEPPCEAVTAWRPLPLQARLL
jgi:cation diffusion facilitator CzcD-associated flavoprotein CzcO